MPIGNVKRRGRWNLKEAEAGFGELIRRAESEGPQTVTVRGRDAAVVLSAEQYRKLKTTEADRPPLVDFLESLDLNGLDLARPRDLGRDDASRA